MLDELKPQYDPGEAEKKIYQLWEDSGYFNPDKLPDAEKREPYTIVMPPPNANGSMHAGHALFVTIEDILIRYQRMRGRRALWLPGTDHAGFETQVVFEKKLEKEGRSRFDMTREEFYKEVWDFVQAHKGGTENGLRRLGASCDWSRNIFTLDPEIIKVVYETFADMHADGLIYRGSRICNWCFKHQTALSDLETKYEEQEDKFYYLNYGPFTIGTARPETKFGDKYVVMHPDDERYKNYTHGQKIELEWINGPMTATIIKDEAADRSFGTGVMTITPWHSAVDFDIAKRHNLDIEQIIDFSGKLLPIAGEFAGQHIKKARAAIVEKLTTKGLVEKIEENYKHNVQMCYKCSTIIEPQVLPQWFVKMTEPFASKKTGEALPSLRDMAVNAIKNKEVEIVTEKFEKIFLHWMENLRDWPISRQIWWGIQIPVKYCGNCTKAIVDSAGTITVCPDCKSEEFAKDTDTFDTWFSSGQWPYATMMANDAKNGTHDMQTYFPTAVMETGWDILFFWVARMVMFSYYKTGKPPFEKVYLHGLVRDKDRQKMSKSKGNVADPLGIIETYGTDALRFMLIFSTTAGTDIPLSEDKIRGMKHFANKLWNISRFVITNLDGGMKHETRDTAEPQTDADREILAKLDAVKKSVTENLEKFQLHEAAQAIYDFTWHEFADVYIEKSKEQLTDEALRGSTVYALHTTFLTILKLLHPFMPFITEHIWGILQERGLAAEKDLLMVAAWPK